MSEELIQRSESCWSDVGDDIVEDQKKTGNDAGNLSKVSIPSGNDAARTPLVTSLPDSNFLGLDEFDQSDSYSDGFPESYQTYRHSFDFPDSYQSNRSNSTYLDTNNRKEYSRRKGDQTDKSNPIMFALVAFICLSAIVAVAMVVLKSNDSLIISTIDDIISQDLPQYSINATSGIGIISLYRSGYEPLGYFTGEYTAKINYKFLKPHIGIVEPHVPMFLYVTDFDTSLNTYYEYSICATSTSDSNSSSTCYDGVASVSDEETTAINIPCSQFEIYSILVTQIQYSDGSPVAAWDGTVVCTYVRRELRALTSEDLSTTMDAMFALWDVSEEEGQSLYGPNYHSAVYFSKAHNFNAAWRDGDHIHEGLGFLTQHTKLSNMFELAMQAVDPSVTLPYWDYTIESAADQTVFDSVAFTPETFGTLVEPKNHTIGWTFRDDPLLGATIRDGRWANITVETENPYPDLTANFGYLRAPWNSNPSPYVSRFAAFTTTLPTCDHFYKWLSFSTLTDFLNDAPYAPHASVHGAIGSVYGCDVMDQLLEAGLILDQASQILLCQKWGFMLKELYRTNFITAWSQCTYTDFTRDGISCGVTCNEDSKYLLSHQLSMIVSSKYTGDLSDDQLDDWVDFLCDGESAKIFFGDHVESASPDDPSFWPMHPSLDRGTQAKYMMGGFTSSVWPTNPEKDYVCDKSYCYEDGVRDYYTQCCYGHFEDDQMLDFVNGDKSSGFGDTNKEVLDKSDPSSDAYGMPYIYDHFQWDHCDLDDFNGLFE